MSKYGMVGSAKERLAGGEEWEREEKARVMSEAPWFNRTRRCAADWTAPLWNAFFLSLSLSLALSLLFPFFITLSLSLLCICAESRLYAEFSFLLLLLRSTRAQLCPALERLFPFYFALSPSSQFHGARDTNTPCLTFSGIYIGMGTSMQNHRNILYTNIDI